jgi:hypothetical protein
MPGMRIGGDLAQSQRFRGGFGIQTKLARARDVRKMRRAGTVWDELAAG